MSARSFGRLGTALTLAALWILLQGQLSAANAFAAALVVGAVMALVPAPGGADHTPRPLGIVRFVTTVLWSLVRSSLTVMVATLLPTPERTRGSLVRVTLTEATPLSLTLVANAISVTPGTITLDSTLADDGTARLDVHVFGAVDEVDFQADCDELHRLARTTHRTIRRTATATAGPGPTASDPSASTDAATTERRP